MEKKTKKNPYSGVRDYVHMLEYMNGTGGAHKSLKDKYRNRKSKQSQREKYALKKYY